MLAEVYVLDIWHLYGAICGIVFAILSLEEGSKVKKFVNQMEMQAANTSIEQTKKWNKYSWISIIISVIIEIIIIFIYILYFGFLIAVSR